MAALRLSRRPKKINIDACIPFLAEYFEHQPDVEAAMVFGSYGTSYQTPLSDVDLAILFQRDMRPSPERVIELEISISDICHEDDINVLSLNDANVMLQFRILDGATSIYERDPIAVCDFREHVFKVYGDFEPFYRHFARQYDGVLREAYSRDRS